MNFSTLQGLTIPEGVVTQIADASGRVIWAVSGGKVVLEVEKVTNDTYAGETTYTAEEFILLDIYPKTNGAVSVTYGGLTKTITDTSGAEEPNAQQVFFGTFNGVSDSVETPTSGRLTIEGDCYAFGLGAYDVSKYATGALCQCVTNIKSFGETTIIPDNAFGKNAAAGANTKTITLVIPDSILSVGHFAFYGWSALKTVTIGRGVTSIGCEAFSTPNVLTGDTKQYSLTTVKVLAETPPVCVPYQFSGQDSPTYNPGFFGVEEIIVPKGCADAYKTSEGWSEYADYIVEAS